MWLQMMVTLGIYVRRWQRTLRRWLLDPRFHTLAQAAGAAALGERGFLQKTRALIPQERQWLQKELEKLGFWVCPSHANYILFHGREDLYGRLREQGIAIRSCHNYHGLGVGWYRIAVRLHEENERLIEAVKEVCVWQKIS